MHVDVLATDVTFTIWLEASRAKAARRAANRFRAFASRTPLPASSSSAYTGAVAVAGRAVNPQALVQRRGYHEQTSTAVTPVRRSGVDFSVPRDPPITGAGAGASQFAVPGGGGQAQLIYATPRLFPSSISMPHLYAGSASNLRKEVFSTTPRRRIATTTTASPATLSSYRRTVALHTPTARAVAVEGAAGRRAYTPQTVIPEDVALPPSSSATTGPSSSSSSLQSSPLARPNDLPVPPLNLDSSSRNQPRPHDSGSGNGNGIRAAAAAATNDSAAAIPSSSLNMNMKHRRKSTLKNAFEEGILKEMTERLNNVGLGGGDGGGKRTS